MLTALRAALGEIECELQAAGEDEVQQNPILAGKRQFVDATWRKIHRWERGE
jgi:hypothetical protein